MLVGLDLFVPKPDQGSNPFSLDSTFFSLGLFKSVTNNGPCPFSGSQPSAGQPFVSVDLVGGAGA